MFLVSALFSLGACAWGTAGGSRDEENEVRDQRFAPSNGSLVDAGREVLDARAADDAGSVALDASTPADAAPPSGAQDADACSPGQVACGAACIDAIQPALAVLQERVFQRSCALARSCHTGNAPQAGLDLGSVDAILSRAVGKPASQVPTLSLLEPGRPEDSYIVRKLRNTHTVGTTMPPPPGAPLCEAKIQAVEAWVRTGASR